MQTKSRREHSQQQASRRVRISGPFRCSLAVAAGACGLAFVSAESTAEQRTPIEYFSDFKQQNSKAHPGLEWPAQIELIPDTLTVSPEGRESVEYHAELTVLRGQRVGIAWDAELMDDRGKVLRATLISKQERGAAGSVHVTAPIVVNLDDGYYALRVRAAVAPDDEASSILERIQYVEIAKGKWIELTVSEWYERSQAGVAFPLDEVTDVSGVAP